MVVQISRHGSRIAELNLLVIRQWFGAKVVPYSLLTLRFQVQFVLIGYEVMACALGLLPRYWCGNHDQTDVFPSVTSG